MPADFQYRIYLEGLAGRTPGLPTDLSRLEELARERMDPAVHDYVAGGAGSEASVRANRAGLDQWRIVPRMLRDTSRRDLGCEVFGQRLAYPVALAPVGVLPIVHPDGEVAAARAAAAVGVPYTLSSVSGAPMETVAAAMGQATRWFQLYWPRDREITRSFLARAQRAGYSALVVTLDTTAMAWRPRDLDRAYLPFLRGVGLANYLTDPAFQAGLARPVEEDPEAAIRHWAAVFSEQGHTWEDLAFLRENWDGPILLKGVLHPDDARRAVDAGAAGVVVSNHGGRQLDGSIGAIEALPEVARAVGERASVLFDSGIRSGTDVVKALALGARAVLLGRPYVYGLGLEGQAGVEHVLRCLLAETDLTLGLCGVAALAGLGPELLRR